MKHPFLGEPIAPHVQKVLEQIKPQIGDVLMHQDLASMADLKYPSGRYFLMISLLRKRLRDEQNLDIQNKMREGYRVLDDNERVDVSIHDFSLSARKLGKAGRRLQGSDTAKLDDPHRQRKDHAERVINRLVVSTNEAKKEIGVAGRIQLLPSKPRPND